MKLLFAFGCGVKEKFVTLCPIEVRIAAIKREWGENPRLSRSCKFHYQPQTIWSTAKVLHHIIYKGSYSGKEFTDGTKSEDLPHDNSTAERPRCKDWEAPLINNDKQEALYRSECR